jgi:hypothetical protein
MTPQRVCLALAALFAAVLAAGVLLTTCTASCDHP